MKIVAYTNDGCGHCSTLKKLFARAAVSFEEIKINKDITPMQFKIQFPTVTGYPYVIIDGEPVGGLTETAKLFLDKGLVEAPK